MLVEIFSSQDEYDYRCAYSIYINGKREISFVDGEPEDNNLCRNFDGVYTIDRLMRMAYEAGKNGEDFECVGEKEISWDEFFEQ